MRIRRLAIGLPQVIVQHYADLVVLVDESLSHREAVEKIRRELPCTDLTELLAMLDCLYPRSPLDGIVPRPRPST